MSGTDTRPRPEGDPDPPATATSPGPVAPPSSAASATASPSTAWVLVLVAGLVLVRLLAIGYLFSDGIDRPDSVLGGDARRYEEIHDTPGTPYRDFDTEYPPVIIGVIYAIDGPSTWDTLVRLAGSQLVLELAIAGLLAWGWSRRVMVTYLVLGTPAVFFPFPWVRTDLVPVFLVVAAMVLAKRNHQILAGVAAATAVFAKFWPVAVAPLFATRRQFRALGAWVLTGVLGTAAWVLWAGTSGIGQVFSFRGSKGWQIESLPGNVLFLLDPGAAHVEGGAWRTAVEVPDLLRWALTLGSFALVALAWWWADQRHRGDDTAAFGLAPLASVTALLVFATIISPQYVLWLVPFAAIVTAGSIGPRARDPHTSDPHASDPHASDPHASDPHASDLHPGAAPADRRFGLVIGAIVLTVVALTTFEFGMIRWMVLDHDLFPATLVLLRNLALVVLVVLTYRRLADREPITARQTGTDGRTIRASPSA